MTAQLEAPTLQELLELVEADATLSTAERARVFVSLVPPASLRETLLDLVERMLMLRQQRGSVAPAGMPREDVQSPLDRRPTPSAPSDRPKAGAPPRQERRHASSKIALATRAWIDLLSTQVTLPDGAAKIEIRDMSADQLHALADSLFDTHERIHRLAEHLELNGVRCARELEPRALEACMSEGAA